ncbi:MAG TPA: hypothetical protein VG269_04810 [Tepidisphaeraceae bacterium]|jgi:hypothetical protein|nr:hypothetical protein [Tepidisphaeraceae bacterium]
MTRHESTTFAKYLLPALTLSGVVAFASVAKEAQTVKAPATAPATTVPTPVPVSEAYKILLSRTMFSRDRGRSASWSERTAAERAEAERLRAIAATQPGGPGRFGSSSPESSLSLKGVTLEDGVYIAFIEDSFAHETLRLQAGENIARGQISAMSLDGIEYAAGGRPRRIGIGQTLDGATPPAASLPASSSPRPGAWPAATAGDTGGSGRDRGGRGARDGESSGPRDFRSRDTESTGQRDFRSRDGRDASPDRGASTTGRTDAPATDVRDTPRERVAADDKPAGPGRPDAGQAPDPVFPPDGFGPP